MGVQRVAADFKIAAVVSCAHPVEGDAFALEMPDTLPFQLGRSDCGYLVHKSQLALHRQLVQLPHGVVAEGDLIEPAGPPGQRLGVFGVH